MWLAFRISCRICLEKLICLSFFPTNTSSKKMQFRNIENMPKRCAKIQANLPTLIHTQMLSCRTPADAGSSLKKHVSWSDLWLFYRAMVADCSDVELIHQCQHTLSYVHSGHTHADKPNNTPSHTHAYSNSYCILSEKKKKAFKVKVRPLISTAVEVDRNKWRLTPKQTRWEWGKKKKDLPCHGIIYDVYANKE